MGRQTPIAGSYWVDPGRLLAGEYPGAGRPEETAARLGRFRAAGIELFVDLTEPLELEPYGHLLDGARHERRPIPDFGTASASDYRGTLDLIDEALGDGTRVYVHCYGGLGRTGTVVGCWLVRHGLDEGDAIDRIARLRRRLPDGRLASPQTPEQRQVVRDWRRGA